MLLLIVFTTARMNLTYRFVKELQAKNMALKFDW